MLVFPGLADQPSNAKKLVEAGMALPLKELTYPEISLKLGQLLDPQIYIKILAELGKSKDYMTSLGGYEKAADIVEKVQRGQIKVIENPPELLNIEELLARELQMYVAIFIVVTVSLAWGTYKCCCGRSLKSKND